MTRTMKELYNTQSEIVADLTGLIDYLDIHSTLFDEDSKQWATRCKNYIAITLATFIDTVKID